MHKIISLNTQGLNGEITIPPDKSISHRAIMLTALANGRSTITNFSKGADCITTLNIFRQLGVKYNLLAPNELEVNSTGYLEEFYLPLDCKNSGTTMRLLAGIIAGNRMNATLTGDESLLKRPMKRVIEPLNLMGATINSDQGKAPLEIKSKKIEGIEYDSLIASAQVKSCVLLAGLNAIGKTVYTEPYQSRNHTEKMLEYMGASISVEKNTITLEPSELQPKDIKIPGDISSAAFFMVAALIVPNSSILIKDVGLNPTRTGIIDVIKAMGGKLGILNKRFVSNEEVGDIRIYSSELRGCEISGDLIPRLIDELPVIALLATQATGRTVIKDAQDLRNKESDRIAAVATELKKIGANIIEKEDGFIIKGKTQLQGDSTISSHKDHRVAMTMYVAGLVCEKPILIEDFEWVDISFPEFESLITKL